MSTIDRSKFVQKLPNNRFCSSIATRLTYKRKWPRVILSLSQWLGDYQLGVCLKSVMRPARSYFRIPCLSSEAIASAIIGQASAQVRPNIP